jgi:hypothetical protein
MLALLVGSVCKAVFRVLKDGVVGCRRQGASVEIEKLDDVIVDPGNKSTAGELDPLLTNAAAPEIQSSI